MAQRTLHDGSTGDVVIRSGPPASGGGSGWGRGGSSGGNRVGASGAFSGPSKNTKKARKQAKEEHYRKQEEQRSRARERQRLIARNQLIAQFTQRQNVTKAEIDGSFAGRVKQLTSSLDQEISAVKRPPNHGSSERWQLYLITKEKNEIDGLISKKTAELGAKNVKALSFDGHNPLTRSASDYVARLEQFGKALSNGHRMWEDAYNAAHEAQLLSAQVNALTQKSIALAGDHAELTTVLREREAQWEQHRLHAEQRDARIRFKQQADADTRLERVKQANTLTIPAPALAAGGMIFTPGAAVFAQEVAATLEKTLQTAVDTLIDFGVIAVRTGPAFVTALMYSPPLGNGELTAEQRGRLFHVVGVPPQTLGLHDHQELQSSADTGGSVEAEYRLKIIATPQGTAIIVASTGGDIDPRVPVVNAVLDPLTGVYTAEIPGAPARYVEFSPDVTSGSASTGHTGLTVTEPQVQGIPAGVDLRIQDCIVCVPGLEPVYLSFNVPALGAGVVTGTGQPASADWWNAASLPQGAAIPVQIGDQFRGREFKSFDAFDKAVWQTLGEQRLLATAFDEVNRKRIEQGFAPYAPKSTWVGEHREFELRYQERPEFWTDPFNLDKISIKAPSSAEGWIGVVPAVVPWPIPPASSWKPLVPPGSEHLGSTTSPITPTNPLIYPGSPVIPVLPPNETFPAVDEGEIGASIPGYPGDMELPSPGLVFVGPPVEPLEVGPYNELSGRSRGDGLDIDHIPSRRALETYMELQLPETNKRERADILKRTPSIAIPAEVHRRFSETYGGRNHLPKQLNDAADLRFAVDRNFDAIKAGLLEKGFDEKDIEIARLKLHELHIEQGWY